MRVVIALLLAVWARAVPAVDPEATERAAVAKQRSAAQARFAAEERDCAIRFAVNACLDDVRTRRREALAPIDAREAELDAAQRQRRAQERRQRIADKEAERARREASAASAPPPQPLDALRSPPRPKASTPEAVPHEPSPAERAARERAARERYESKQREAAAHREEIERRNAEEKQPAAPPLPPASAR